MAYGLRGRQPPTPLWHAQIGALDNAAETYTVNGQQYVLVAGDDTVWAFALQ